MKRLINVFILVMMCEIMCAEGALNGAFSVSATKKVHFSMGNLQYNAGQGTHQCADGTAGQGIWRFAEHQYDIIGYLNENISADYDGWIDLFGWGTSGWNSGATCYQPYSTSNSYIYYWVNGDYKSSLVGDYSYSDWGVYNAISNGGNQPGVWCTLAKDEWVYLFTKRTNATKLYFLAKVNGVSGLVVLPDDWDSSLINQTYKLNVANYTSNVYTSAQWDDFERYGAIFLPLTGERLNTGISSLNKYGFYWSTTAGNMSLCYDLCISTTVTSSHSYGRYYGLAVRLVMEEEDYEGLFTDVEMVQGEKIKVYAKSGKIVIENATSEVEVYDVMGRVIERGVLNEVEVPTKGIYIVKIDGEVRKVVVK